MLTLSAINNIDYYKNIDGDDYYVSEESLGIWHGKLKGVLKLGENVDTDSFERILKNKHPKKNKDLLQANQNKKKELVGI